jgi:cytochrome P450
MSRMLQAYLERIFSNLGIVLLEGGTDTSAAYLQSLVLLMAAFPNIQKTAQGVIDTVVGDARLPALDDMKQLPYIDALIKEVIKHWTLLYSTADESSR